nr:zinc finger, CCHC-type [Tanacetum cinerariifolium]
ILGVLHKQKSRIDYFDPYAPVARISTIRLLITMASIHNLIIHQMTVKTTFLNRELEEEVDLTKEFLSSRFSMNDMREEDVILGIRIKHESNGIAISQSYYIEKVLKKFNYSDCTLVSTPLDTCEKLMPNKGTDITNITRKEPKTGHENGKKTRVVQSTGKIKRLKKQSRLRAKIRARGACIGA